MCGFRRMDVQCAAATPKEKETPDTDEDICVLDCVPCDDVHTMRDARFLLNASSKLALNFGVKWSWHGELRIIGGKKNGNDRRQ